jgi:hypothetical protein
VKPEHTGGVVSEGVVSNTQVAWICVAKYPFGVYICQIIYFIPSAHISCTHVVAHLFTHNLFAEIFQYTLYFVIDVVADVTVTFVAPLVVVGLTDIVAPRFTTFDQI